MRIVAIVSFVCLALGAFACSGNSETGADAGSTGGADAADGEQERYFPMAVGASWTYRVVDLGTGVVATKMQTVEALEDVGGQHAGTEAFRLRADKSNGYTLSWQQDTGSAIVRLHEQAFDLQDVQKSDEWYLPSKMRMDETSEHLMLDSSYAYTFDEQVTDVALATTTTTTKTETWTVEAIGESVTVPAGTFSCLRLLRVTDTTGVQKRYWFARGVGKVKEEGGMKREELHSFSLP